MEAHRDMAAATAQEEARVRALMGQPRAKARQRPVAARQIVPEALVMIREGDNPALIEQAAQRILSPETANLAAQVTQGWEDAGRLVVLDRCL